MTASSITAIEWRIGEPGVMGELRIATRINRQGARRFAVICDGWVLNKDGEWEYEVQPSSRDEAFYDRCRFCEFEAAYHAAIKATPRGDLVALPDTRGGG